MRREFARSTLCAMGSVETDLSPDEERVQDIHQGFVEAYGRIAWLVHDVFRWIDGAKKDDEAFKNLARRFAHYDENRDEPLPPELQADEATAKMVELSSTDIFLVRQALERSVEMKAHYRELVSELAVVYLVAAFEAFLGDLLKFILCRRPEFLKASGKSLSFAEIIDAKETLIEELAEREVRAWQYKSFRDLIAILRDRFSVDVDRFEGVDADSLVETFARRNLLMHNRALVNETYLKLTPTSGEKVGERLETTPDYWAEKSKELSLLASNLTRAMGEHHLEPSD